MSARSAADRCQEITNRITWGRAALSIMVHDSGLEEVRREALMASIEHLSDALEELEALHADVLREGGKRSAVVPIRKVAPADAEPEHAQ